MVTIPGQQQLLRKLKKCLAKWHRLFLFLTEQGAVYTQNNRPELAENELAEAAVLEVFMPKQLSGEELETVLKVIIAQVGAASPADMGKVMGVATKQLAGQADGRAISEAVKKLLQ